MNEVLKQIQNIGNLSATLCVLKALRSKVELNRTQPNRISGHHPNLKMAVLTGRAGTGKTWCMRSIYNGLRLHQTNETGMPIAVWLDGSSTAVGRRERLRENPTAIYLWNELNVTDAADVKLLKQLTEGVISYLKFGSLDETKFTGLIIANTNEFYAKGRVGADVEALRDRADIVDVGPPEGYHPLLAIEKEKHYYAKKQAKINWKVIADALVRETDEVLTEEERELIRPFWKWKIRECLDDRVLTRSGSDFIDCFTFAKRFFGTLHDELVFDAAIGLAYDSVTISAIAIANLSLIQRDLVNALNLSPDKIITTSDAKIWLQRQGRYINNSTLHRNLNTLIEKGYIIRIQHNEYSLLKPNVLEDNPNIQEFDELLKVL